MKNSNQKTEMKDEVRGVEISESVIVVDDDFATEIPDIYEKEVCEVPPAGRLTISDVINLKVDLETYNKHVHIDSWSINICVNDNLEAINQSLRGVEAYEKSLQKPLKQFNKEKEKLILKYATLDGIPQLEVKDGITSYLIPKENRKSFSEAMDKLNAKHKDVLDVYNKRYNEHLENIQTKVSTYQPIYLSRDIAAKEAPKIDTEVQKLIYKLLEPFKK